MVARVDLTRSDSPIHPFLCSVWSRHRALADAPPSPPRDSIPDDHAGAFSAQVGSRCPGHAPGAVHHSAGSPDRTAAGVDCTSAVQIWIHIL